jgi:hypothetical protein
MRQYTCMRLWRMDVPIEQIALSLGKIFMAPSPTHKAAHSSCQCMPSWLPPKSPERTRLKKRLV